MAYLSQTKYEEEMKRLQSINASKERKMKLDAERNKLKPHIKISASKLIVAAMILLNVQIVLFVEYAMIKWGDFSAAYALIGIPATLIPTIYGYYSKAKAENTKNGIVYETAMAQLNGNSGGNDEESVG